REPSRIIVWARQLERARRQELSFEVAVALAAILGQLSVDRGRLLLASAPRSVGRDLEQTLARRSLRIARQLRPVIKKRRPMDRLDQVLRRRARDGLANEAMAKPKPSIFGARQETALGEALETDFGVERDLGAEPEALELAEHAGDLGDHD